jgi:hypothetical protein
LDRRRRSATFTQRTGLALLTKETPAMSITGDLITETFEYDGGREVTV